MCGLDLVTAVSLSDEASHKLRLQEPCHHCEIESGCGVIWHNDLLISSTKAEEHKRWSVGSERVDMGHNDDDQEVRLGRMMDCGANRVAVEHIREKHGLSPRM